MYETKLKAESSYELTPVNEAEIPGLILILEGLQNAVNRYDSILKETRQKLQTILKYDEPMNESVKEKEPESIIEDINRWLIKLHELNSMAEMNLRHLKKIG